MNFWTDKVRPVLEKRPGVSLGIVGVGVIAVAFYAWPSLRDGGPPMMSQSAYFTTDDGKSLFEDNDPHDIPPFDHEGHEAVRAYFVPGKTPGRTDSIWYLSKMTDDHKTQLEAMMTNGPGSAAPSPPKATAGVAGKPSSMMGGQLIKRPGDAEWIPLDDTKAGEILKLPG